MVFQKGHLCSSCYPKQKVGGVPAPLYPSLAFSSIDCYKRLIDSCFRWNQLRILCDQNRKLNLGKMLVELSIVNFFCS